MKKNNGRNDTHEEILLPRFPTEGLNVDANTSRQLLKALTALKKGDFSARLPLDWNGTAGKIADAFNDVIERNERMALELERLSRVVGKEGKINQRATIGEVT